MYPFLYPAIILKHIIKINFCLRGSIAEHNLLILKSKNNKFYGSYLSKAIPLLLAVPVKENRVMLPSFGIIENEEQSHLQNLLLICVLVMIILLKRRQSYFQNCQII